MGIPRSKWVNPLDPEGVHKPVGAGYPGSTSATGATAATGTTVATGATNAVGSEDVVGSGVGAAVEAEENGRESDGGKLKQNSNSTTGGDPEPPVNQQATESERAGILGEGNEGDNVGMMLD